jgi:electron transport complex protein RnfB
LTAIALTLFGLLLAGVGVVVCAGSRRDGRRDERIIDRVDAILPQTQCRQCGFSGCRPYAEAIVRSGAGINRCPPGGESTVRALAELLGADPEPLRDAATERSVVTIDEALCIGCTKCIQACPVDAIIGAPRQMHTVLLKDCTGCGLCIPPCPVDCIAMVPAPMDARDWHWPKPAADTPHRHAHAA